MWAFILGLATKIPALLTPLGPLFAGFNVISFFNSVVANVKKNWRFYLPVFLVVLQLGTAFGWYHDHGLLIKEREALKQEIINVKNAQAIATAQANAERAVLQKESKLNADQADTKYNSLLAEYRANLLRFRANQGTASPASNNQLPTPQGGNGPSASTQVSPAADQIIISMEDAQICAVNTARLQAVHDWAINPPKDGVTTQ